MDAFVEKFISSYLRPDLATKPRELQVTDMSLRFLEFEARLCTPSRSNSTNTTISQAQYDRMIKAAMSLAKSSCITTTILERYGHFNANITATRPDNGFGVDFRHKRKLGTLDIAMKGSPFDLRLAASLELPVKDKPTQRDVTERFTKERTALFMSNTLRLDFTKLVPFGTNTVGGGGAEAAVHQVEIEVIDVDSAMRSGVSPLVIWGEIKELVSFLSESCDMSSQRTITYSLIKQRIY